MIDFLVEDTSIIERHLPFQTTTNVLLSQPINSPRVEESMRLRTVRLLTLLAGTFVLLLITSVPAFGADLSPIQQSGAPDKTPLTPEMLEKFWQDLYPGGGFSALASPSSAYNSELLAKAEIDDCFSEIGVLPLNPPQTCEGATPAEDETPKVNETHVTAMTSHDNVVWFSTGPNIHCLMLGMYLFAPLPNETDSHVCEFFENQRDIASTLPPFIGDWRPPSLYMYDNNTGDFIFISPDGLNGYIEDSEFVSNTLEIRSAVTFGDYVFFAGPDLTGGGINVFIYNAVSRAYLGSTNVPGYTDIRKWLVVDDVLYATVGVGYEGAVLRYRGDPTSSDPLARVVFEEVGYLDAPGFDMALHEGRIFVTTWPVDICGCEIAGLWMSPALPPTGLTDTDFLNWEGVFFYDEYEPDETIAATYGGGALLSYNGDLYWGSMHIPELGFVSHITEYGGDYAGVGGPTDQDLQVAMLASERSSVIFRGHNFTSGTPEIELLYGLEYLPVFDPFDLTWYLEPNLLDVTFGITTTPAYGAAGIGDAFNNFTWSMAEYDDQLFVGTMDWSLMQDDFVFTIIDLLRLPFGFTVPQPPSLVGADLYRFYSSSEPALAVDQNGLGNYSNYGFSALLSMDSDLFIGTANPLNLRTDPTDDEPEGGWELLKLTRFTPSLTVGLGGNGSGAVTGDPGGIDCGITCTSTYDPGELVLLTPTAEVGSTFTGWVDACLNTGPCTVEILDSRFVTANFTLDTHSLNVSLAGDGEGSVLSSPTGINCGTACDELYDYGTLVDLTATADDGSLFTGWEGACAGTGACSVTITATRQVTATFANNLFPVKVKLAGTGTGSVLSDPDGINCGTACDELYEGGSTVELTATASAGSLFSGWDGACNGTGLCTITVDDTNDVTATFANNHFPLEVTLAGDGTGSVLSNLAGINCGTACNASYDGGTKVILTATASPGSIFTGWSGDCSSTGTCTVTISETNRVTATFTNNRFPLTVTLSGDGEGSVISNPAGINCGTACDKLYDGGTTVILTATANAGSLFTGWSGDCNGTGTCSIAIDQTNEVTATFANNLFPLVVALAGDGEGSVISDPDGINCGTACDEFYLGGTTVDLTPTASAGSLFTGWDGDCTGTGPCTVTITETNRVTATFANNRFLLEVALAGDGSGSVLSNPAGINCGTACDELYDGGATIELTATPNPGSLFTGWSGDCTGTGVCTVTISETNQVIATFANNRFPLTVLLDGDGSGSVLSDPDGINCGTACDELYDGGSTVELTATPSPGSIFTGWSGACSGPGSCIVTIGATNEVTATFTNNRFPLEVTLAGTGTGSVVSNPGGVNCGTTCTALFDGGATVELTATPSAGSIFTGWSGECTGTGVCTVTIDDANEVIATFTNNRFLLEVSLDGTGSGSVLSDPDGINCGTACDELYDGGTLVELTASPSAGSLFVGWSGECDGTDACTVTIDNTNHVTATFIDNLFSLEVTLAGTGTGSVLSDPAGINCGTACEELFIGGATVNLTATPSAGSVFTGWSGACSGTGICKVTIDDTNEVIATFTNNRFSLEVTLDGDGTGSVLSDPAGINCGTACDELYDGGSTVELTATPSAGSLFAGWSGACDGTATCTVTIDETNHVIATFINNRFSLEVTLAGDGAGSVLSEPTGINCGTACESLFDGGSTVDLTATPSAGSLFGGWSGACTGTGPCTVTIDEVNNVTATFINNRFELDVTLAGDGTGSVLSDPDGINCGTACEGLFDGGATVELTATPNAGSLFTGWSGDCTGTGVCTVTISKTNQVIATFVNNRFPLEVALAGDGAGSVLSNPEGINCGTACEETFDGGTTVDLIPTAAAGSVFTGWEGVCSGTDPCSVTIGATNEVTATFANNRFSLGVTLDGDGTGSVLSDPDGINCGTACDELFDGGTTVDLTATPSAGSIFTGWDGACSGTDTCSVTISEATNVIATFANNRFPLTVALAGNGSGSVTSDPGGINCGTACEAIFDGGETVDLTPTANSGSLFVGWGGACSGTGVCTVTVDETNHVIATFANNRFALTVTLAGDGSGSVVSSVEGINCGTACVELYDGGTTVDLTATADAGSIFTGWGGVCSGTGICTVTIDEINNVIANFANNRFSLTVALDGDGSGSVVSDPAGINCGTACDETYDGGTTVILTPTASAGSIFTGWSGACSGTGPCTVTIDETNDLTATFANNRFPLVVNIAGEGSGSVVSLPAGIACNQPSCNANFDSGTVVALSAVGFSGSSFESWSGACTGTGNDECQVTIGPGTTTVTATFGQSTQQVSLDSAGQPFIGSPMTFTATLNMNPVTECTWDFGDGETLACSVGSEDMNTAGVDAVNDITIQALHAFSEAGVYIVTITATNDAGTVVATHQVAIQTPTNEEPTDQPKTLFFPLLHR